MNFIWQATQLSDDENCEIEQNIASELETVDGIDETEIVNWTVHLSEDRLRNVLVGVLIDLTGKPRVRFTYSLEGKHFAEYQLISS
jgi:hypothetical protein